MTDERILTDELVEVYVDGHKVGAWRRRAPELAGFSTVELGDDLFIDWPNAAGIRPPIAGLQGRARTEVLDPALTSGALDRTIGGKPVTREDLAARMPW